MRLVSRLICGFLILLAVTAAAEPYSVIFERGNDFYAKGEWPKAVNEYQKVLVAGFESAELYYNLGNAYFRDGQLGHAIVNYIRAKRLEPRDEDIHANLNFAKKFAIDKIEVTESTIIFNYINNFFDSFNLDEITVIAFISYLMLIAAILIKYSYRIFHLPTPAFVIIALLFATSAIFSAVKLDRDVLTRSGVVIIDSIDVKNGPGEDFDTKFTAHAGLVFNIESEESDYYSVNFENRLKGWIAKGAVEEI